MDLLEWLAGISVFIGSTLYVIAIVRGKSTPAKVTWMIWFINDFVTAFSMPTLNPQVAVIAAFALITLLLALKYGENGWTRIDKFSLPLAAVGIGMYFAFDNKDYALYMSLSVATVGVLPWLRRIWRHPEQEDVFAWLFFTAGCVFTIAHLPGFSITGWPALTADTVQPYVYFTLNNILVSIIVYRRVVRRPKRSQ